MWVNKMCILISTEQQTNRTIYYGHHFGKIELESWCGSSSGADVSFQHRAVYRQFIDEMIIQPGSKSYDSNRADVTLEDHVSSKMNTVKNRLSVVDTSAV